MAHSSAILRVALAQINVTVGDLSGNTKKILTYLDNAREVGADIVVFPELTITGYPPEDLVFKPQFIDDNRRYLEEVIRATKDITAVVGFVDAQRDVYNAAAFISNGKLAGVYHKIFLPTYGVFDEDRYFQSGNVCPVYSLPGVDVGVNICEDIWYAMGPTVVQADAGAHVVMNINGSPFEVGRADHRRSFVSTRAIDNGIYICYVNMVGGQDELVFDGGSMILNPKGEVIAQGKRFDEDLIVADLDIATVLRHRLKTPRHRKQSLVYMGQDIGSEVVTVADGGSSLPKPPLTPPEVERLSTVAEVYAALVTGTRDYVRKSGFQRVLIGLSGGIDSTLVAAIASDALGPESVIGVAMPSRYNPSESQDDAELLAKNFGLEFHAISIEPTFKVMLSTLSGIFEGTEPNVAEENIQARIRGNLLMAISNKFGWLVLTTGNKSEMAMGYATLYGDMAGGFAVIKDVPKILVYELSTYRNSLQEADLIPMRVIEKAPSAELRPDQTDQDSLPPYPILDGILKAYVEEDQSFQEILGLGYDEATVKQVLSGVDRNEYKRRQSPPGVKITPRAFGRDRRLPLVNKYRSF
ncbi:MAG: NAD+ synthase [Chloroflexi bacterium]|nr:NAD+ synthase [Chloroflexota bacterium]